MARFYFDVVDGRGFHHDDVGDDFDGFDEAREQAQSLLPDIAREEYASGDGRLVWERRGGLDPA